MPSEPGKPVVPVAVGVLTDAAGRVLVQRRPDHSHLGGTWEFPGGKAMPGEGREAALAREIREELDVEIRAARPLIRIRHAYPGKTVVLDVWNIERFDGTPRPMEGQPLQWVAPVELSGLEMPPADRPIIHAIRLPETCLITGDSPEGMAGFMDRLEARLDAGFRLIQLRTRLDESRLEQLVREAAAACERREGWLVLNGDPAQAMAWGAHGVHLNGQRLRLLKARPVPRDRWLSAACHDDHELALAIALDTDFVLASPVKPTNSHPGRPILGLEGFERLCARAPMPVYALGGMTMDDLEAVRQVGGQGVAGISGFWGPAGTAPEKR